MATWLLPDNMADILPQQMRVLEKMRRTCLDLFASHGFEQVEPPMIEFVSSLLTGSGSDLDNQRPHGGLKSRHHAADCAH